ncbi:MAG: hypothetical protein ACYCUF_12715, partial [Acidimicrobiales bacterium]
MSGMVFSLVSAGHAGWSRRVTLRQRSGRPGTPATRVVCARKGIMAAALAALAAFSNALTTILQRL